MNESRQIKYQKYILDVLLKAHFPHSYGMIAESKKTLKDLIYKKFKGEIDYEFYMFSHHQHLARLVFLEHEIDKVRQDLIEQYIGENKPENIFNKDKTYLSTIHSLEKGPFKLFHFSVMHHAMFKSGTAHKTYRERELGLYQYVIDVENDSLKLVKESVPMIELFATINVLDDDLRKVCDTYLYGESVELPNVTPLKSDDFRRLMKSYQAKLSNDKENVENNKPTSLPENWSMKDELLQVMTAKKTEWFTRIEEQRKSQKAKSVGTQKTTSKQPKD